MKLAIRFWKYLLLWTGILLVLLLAVTGLSGMPAREVMASLPVWLGLALALAAYPAGVAVAADTLLGGRLDVRRTVAVGLAALAVSAAMLTLGNAVGPRLARSLATGSAGTDVHEASFMTYSELKTAARAAVEAAEAEPGPPTVDGWREANTLVWYFVRRTDGTALPFLFAVLGVLCGTWAGRTPRRDLRRTQLWAMGLFLVMSTYLAGENSFELIAARVAGPAFFAADLVLVVPCLLIIGIGWPTVIAGLTMPENDLETLHAEFAAVADVRPGFTQEVMGAVDSRSARVRRYPSPVDLVNVGLAGLTAAFSLAIAASGGVTTASAAAVLAGGVVAAAFYALADVFVTDQFGSR